MSGLATREGRLQGKVAAITGAAAGIGRATGILFAEEGARLGIADVDSRSGEETANQIRATGVQAFFHKADVTSGRDVERFIRRIIQNFGRIDILVNNAGIAGPSGLLSELRERDWDRVLAVNLKGVYLCSKPVIPYMLRQNAGSIVNVASELGLVGSQSRPAYSASKGGVIALTRSMALQLAPHGIRVNCICPGATDTKLLREFIGGAREREAIRSSQKKADEILEEIPLRRLGKPEEIAHAALYLASDESSFVTGSALVVDGGSTAQ